jgi:glycosyltransferase involved in cell wall biosynthesis
MKHICVDARLISNSGIGTYLRNLLTQFKRAPFRFQLIARPQDVQKFPLFNDFDLLMSTAPIFSVVEQFNLPRLIPKCDLFWSPHFNIPIFPLRAKRRVVTVHDVYPLAFFSQLTFLEKTFARCLFLRLSQVSDFVITDSEFSKSELLKYTSLPLTKISSIHLGVDQKHFFSNKEGVQARIQLPEKFILFVGNLKRHKNLKGLVKAFYILQNKGIHDLHLVIVGKKTNMRSVEDPKSLLENYSSLQEKVHFFENMEDRDLPVLYQKASLCVIPSFYEGFGLPPIEAMSSGCPVVVSNAASLGEVCGEACEYVNPHDPEDIARGIEKVLHEEAYKNRLIALGLERASGLTWEKTAAKHLEIFEQVCSS